MGRATGLVFIATLLIVWLALAFAGSDQAVRIGEDSETLLRTEELLNAATEVRSTIDLALVFASAEQSGLATEESTDAITAAGRAYVHEIELSLERLVQVDGNLTSTISTATAAVVSSSTETFDLLDQDLLADAENEARTSLNAAVDGLRNVLLPYRDEKAAVVAAERGEAGRMARAASFGVAFLVPAMAILMFRSISRRRQRQAELEASLEQEKELGRVRDQLIASLSHELRTPLTAVYGFALAMRDHGFADPQTASDMTDSIIGEAGRLGRMVDDLLVAAKQQTGALEFQTDDVDIVREIREALTPFEHEDHRPEVVVAPGRVRADRFRIRHVVTNLVANAIDHGGSSIAVNGLADGDWYHCSVIDDGPGVPQEMVDKLFTSYVHDGDRSVLAGSVGLGLGVAEMLVREMGGDIRYERRQGFTVFHFRIPAARSEPLDASHRQDASGDTSRSNTRDPVSAT